MFLFSGIECHSLYNYLLLKIKFYCRISFNYFYSLLFKLDFVWFFAIAVIIFPHNLTNIMYSTMLLYRLWCFDWSVCSFDSGGFYRFGFFRRRCVALVGLQRTFNRSEGSAGRGRALVHRRHDLRRRLGYSYVVACLRRINNIMLYNINRTALIV